MQTEVRSAKVEAMYLAIAQLLSEGVQLGSMTVSEITAKAGIGKGTAYEYFSNKEEMIAGALFYFEKKVSLELYEQLKKEQGLYKKMYAILNHMEEMMKHNRCFHQVIHVMMDDSVIGKLRQEMIQNKSAQEMGLTDVIRRIVKEEFVNEQIPSAEELEYLVLMVFSKLLCFVLALCEEKNCLFNGRDYAIDHQNMKKRICESICMEMDAVLLQ